MTETASDIITDALMELVVQADEQAITASESQSAIRYMNRFMFMLDANGVNLGYTEVSNLGDTITIPSGAIMGLVKNLAILLAPQFDAIVPQELRVQANDALRAMRRLGSTFSPSLLPCTLPIGSGNEDGFYQTERFYPCPDSDILTETNRSILLEDAT
jgi:hypothetical protein